MFSCAGGFLFIVHLCAVRDNCVHCSVSHEEGAISMFSIDQKMHSHLCFIVFHYDMQYHIKLERA
jgi:hypothetical protein